MSVFTAPDGTVRATLTVQLHDSGRRPSTPVRVRLSWKPDDPCAITAKFISDRADRCDVTWVLSRDVLIGGITSPCGTGDCVVFPVQTRVWIVLESPNGHGEFDADPARLSEFLAATVHRCPLGSEYDDYDMDADLALLLDGELA